MVRAPPRTTSRRHIPLSLWSVPQSLYTGRPRSCSATQPPAPPRHLSRPLGTTAVPWDKTVGSNQTTVSDERRWGQVCRALELAHREGDDGSGLSRGCGGGAFLPVYHCYTPSKPAEVTNLFFSAFGRSLRLLQQKSPMPGTSTRTNQEREGLAILHG